jgi:hypothetical protein
VSCHHQSHPQLLTFALIHSHASQQSQRGLSGFTIQRQSERSGGIIHVQVQERVLQRTVQADIRIVGRDGILDRGFHFVLHEPRQLVDVGPHGSGVGVNVKRPFLRAVGLKPPQLAQVQHVTWVGHFEHPLYTLQPALRSIPHRLRRLLFLFSFAGEIKVGVEANRLVFQNHGAKRSLLIRRVTQHKLDGVQLGCELTKLAKRVCGKNPRECGRVPAKVTLGAQTQVIRSPCLRPQKRKGTGVKRSTHTVIEDDERGFNMQTI